MDKILELFENFKAFIIKEFLWFFLSLFIAMLLTLTSLWLLNEFSIALINRLEWQGMEHNSIYLALITAWFVIIYLIRCIRGAILFLLLPKEAPAAEA